MQHCNTLSLWQVRDLAGPEMNSRVPSMPSSCSHSGGHVRLWASSPEGMPITRHVSKSPYDSAKLCILHIPSACQCSLWCSVTPR